MTRVWLDLGDLGAFITPASAFDLWQDHGLGLLRTILTKNGVETELRSTRALRRWDDLAPMLVGYDVLLMNVRSYTFPLAREAARIYKAINPRGMVVVGGMHATVALAELERDPLFDRVVRGAGEQVIVDLAKDPASFPRVTTGTSARSMDDWPRIDRTLWPNPRRADYPWPLEGACGWGPGPVATVLTSRVCPWQCAFCNEASYIANMGRRAPEAVVEELNDLDARFGPIGSVVIHDSMFFQQPAWLAGWIRAYTTKARRRWPYWAAARADTVRRWPDLFEALVRETNWNMVSIGFESGSDRVLRTLNKECTASDNYFAIQLLNRIADDQVARGLDPPRFWANIMFGVPGETRDDAFDTMRMIQEMRHRQLSTSYYAAYPGSALGYQIIAEGRSLLTDERYHRYPTDEKVQGIDYAFYRDLLAGRYDDEVKNRPVPAPTSTAVGRAPAHRFFLFDLPDGTQKLSYGVSAADAIETLRLRLPDAALGSLSPERATVIAQRNLQQHIDRLG